ncbi:RraA family protein [Methylobacterium oryzihabitans]|uniref:Putative 4-hydroxy-4-methyl-2-oxoglutarate aldolase n=1 Tax=Methylobacterium oryzihabitans TaxID=2499852 RepID=A0A437PBN2_9HYPH|nr:RraA family protein [Methylobacterium oryzihabitans]RVU19667.1 RraA family protein [Methylobacterium oryzihabitans]
MSQHETAEALRLLAGVETATIGHFRDDGFMAPSIQGLGEATRICGPALTAALPGDDGSALAGALAQARPGDVLVVDRQGDERHACWGAVLTAAALAVGLAGVVIDGPVTDLTAIRASGLPIWFRGRSPLTTKRRGGGTVGGTVRCGGVTVRPGDLVLADENGVAVLDPAEALAVARYALTLQAEEPGIIARLRAGETLADIQAAAAMRRP